MSPTIRWMMVFCAITLSLIAPLPCLRRLHSEVSSVGQPSPEEVVQILKSKLAGAHKKLVELDTLIASSGRGSNSTRTDLSCRYPHYQDNRWLYSCSPEGTCPYEIDLHTGAGVRYIACKVSKPRSPKVSEQVLNDNSKAVLEKLKDVWDTIETPDGDTVANSSDIHNYFNSYKTFLEKVPKWNSVSERYASETGIVFFAGGERFLSALTTALYIKTHLGSILPVEIWKDSNISEGLPTEKMINIAEAHEITFRTLPADYGVDLYSWNDQWVNSATERKPILGPHTVWMSMKPMVVLASRFETVIFFDDDAIPIVPPESLLHLFSDPSTSAIFWRDVWALFSDSYIWEYLPSKLDVQHPMPSQDSGVLVVRKSLSWEALALSVFFNIRHKIFYPAIYFDQTSGHTAFGTGDKDTFQIAWMATGTKFHLMPPVSLVGAHRWRCGSTLGQPGYNTSVAILHMNSFKLRVADYQSGKWKKWFETRPKTGFALQSSYTLNNINDANRNDGKNRDQIKWSGVRKSGAARCLKWVRPFREEGLEGIAGRDVGPELRKFYESVFSAPWAENFLRNLPQ